MLGFQHTEHAVVNAPQEAVFKIVSDLGGHAEMAGSGEVKTVRRLNDVSGVGAKFEADEVIRVMGRTTKMTAESEIVELDAPSVVSWTSMPSVPPQPRRIQWWFRLTPTDGGTEVAHECQVDFGPINFLVRGPYALMRGGAVKRGMRQTLVNLQTRV
jgi:hypothetical protein